MRIPFHVPIAAALLAACAASADALIVDGSSGCVVHNPNPRAGETIEWSGGCKDGTAHGAGVLHWFLHGDPNGRFEGNLVRGRIDGAGTAYYPSGNRYAGEFSEGVPDGAGTFHFKDGRRLVGRWSDGKPDGPGVMFSADGAATPQMWENGKLVN